MQPEMSPGRSRSLCVPADQAVVVSIDFLVEAEEYRSFRRGSSMDGAAAERYAVVVLVGTYYYAVGTDVLVLPDRPSGKHADELSLCWMW